jgi:hypothetical protein
MEIPAVEARALRRMYLPEAYRDPEFIKWMGEMMNEPGHLAHWYYGGDISQEHADIFMTIETPRMTYESFRDLFRDPKSYVGDGSNSDMPPRWFRTICLAVGPGYDGLVWISNDPDWSGP